MTEQFPTYRPVEPYSASVEGYTAHADDWPNTVRVEAVTGYDPRTEPDRSDDDVFADQSGERGLVEIDTNYKATRPGEHPVRLTRADAVQLAGAVLHATEATFHYLRCGRLRPREAAELLRALQEVEYQLTELREHALNDLFEGTGLGEPTDADTDEVTQSAADATPSPLPLDQQLAAALDELFPTTLFAITTADAYAALSHKVNRRCQDTGATPLQVLSSIDPDDRAFAPNADDPAAFLASRIDI